MAHILEIAPPVGKVETETIRVQDAHRVTLDCIGYVCLTPEGGSCAPVALLDARMVQWWLLGGDYKTFAFKNERKPRKRVRLTIWMWNFERGAMVLLFLAWCYLSKMDLTRDIWFENEIAHLRSGSVYGHNFRFSTAPTPSSKIPDRPVFRYGNGNNENYDEKEKLKHSTLKSRR